MATNDSTPRTIEIPLTKGYVAIVDEQDADLALLRWKTITGSNGRHYACRQVSINKRYITIYLHRLILERKLGYPIPIGYKTDHEDNDPLNDTRDNLRLATHTQNMRNSRKRINNSTGYKGVSYHKRDKRYRAEITVDRNVIGLGWYGDAKSAYDAYCEAAIKYFGEFARFE